VEISAGGVILTMKEEETTGRERKAGPARTKGLTHARARGLQQRHRRARQRRRRGGRCRNLQRRKFGSKEHGHWGGQLRRSGVTERHSRWCRGGRQGRGLSGRRTRGTELTSSGANGMERSLSWKGGKTLLQCRGKRRKPRDGRHARESVVLVRRRIMGCRGATVGGRVPAALRVQ
jgi:hypothetical protein